MRDAALPLIIFFTAQKGIGSYFTMTRGSLRTLKVFKFINNDTFLLLLWYPHAWYQWHHIIRWLYASKDCFWELRNIKWWWWCWSHHLVRIEEKCWIWGEAPLFEQYNQFDGQRSLLTGFHLNFLSSPHFWHFSSILTFCQARQKWPILTTKRTNLRSKKKVIFWNHIDKKTGSNWSNLACVAPYIFYIRL